MRWQRVDTVVSQARIVMVTLIGDDRRAPRRDRASTNRGPEPRPCV